MVGVSTWRAPIGATVSKASNSQRTTFAKVSVCQKVSPTLLTAHIKVAGLWMVLLSASTEALWHHWRIIKRLQRVSSCLYILRPPFFPSISSLQMWMSVCSRECVSMAAVSIWTAPTNALVTTVTKSPQTAKLAKVCNGLSGAVGCNSSLHTPPLVELSWQKNNVCKWFLFLRCQWVRCW